MTDSSFTDEMLRNIKDNPAPCVDAEKNPVVYIGVDPPLPIGKIQQVKRDFRLLDSTGAMMASGRTIFDTLSKWAETELKRRESKSQKEMRQMPMKCKFRHDHPSRPVTVAENNQTEPWGVRPVHCPDCRFTRRDDKNDENWKTYTTVDEIRLVMNNRRLCRICFPQ